MGGCWARTGSQTMVRLPARLLQTHLSRLFGKLSCFKCKSRILVLGTIRPLVSLKCWMLSGRPVQVGPGGRSPLAEDRFTPQISCLLCELGQAS